MMITQGYVWMLAEIYLGSKNNPNASSKDNKNTCADHAAGSEMENHKASDKTDGFESKHEDARACNEDKRHSH